MCITGIGSEASLVVVMFCTFTFFLPVGTHLGRFFNFIFLCYRIICLFFDCQRRQCPHHNVMCRV